MNGRSQQSAARRQTGAVVGAWPDAFAARLIDWQRRHGRHDLPWQGADAYGIWLSEVMLQQTQVTTVLRYYPRFRARFAHVQALAAAPLDEVLAHWSGLGYYRRARMLHAAAQQIVQRHGGHLPQTAAQWAQLPGVGRSTAAAIAAFSRGERAAILDGNVKRVFRRLFADILGPAPAERALWDLAERLLPTCTTPGGDGAMAAYTQGLMDLGATLCTPQAPNCPACPFRAECRQAQDPTEAAAAAPAPRRAPRRRQDCVMLLLRAGDRWLFEQRASVGIWPGLWCWPQAPDEAAAAVRAAELLGLRQTPQLRVGAAVKHAFTHFDLWVRPARLDRPQESDPPPERILADAAGAPLRWLREQDFAGVGMPAIVGKLLRALG